jgi:hypothetical protein
MGRCQDEKASRHRADALAAVAGGALAQEDFALLRLRHLLGFFLGEQPGDHLALRFVGFGLQQFVEPVDIGLDDSEHDKLPFDSDVALGTSSWLSKIAHIEQRNPTMRQMTLGPAS